MNESIRLGRIAGIPVGLNWSLLAVFWLLSWSLASEALPSSAPGHSSGAYWAVAVTTTVLFYATLLAHELAHSLVSRRNGIGVRRITLWLFGGVAQLEGEATSPGAEFRIAIAGPLTSVAASALFGAVAVAADAIGSSNLVVAGAAWLAGINVTLAVFNLVPGAPLDGGRVLRAALWRAHGDPVRAAVSASRAGRVIAYLLIGAGLLSFSGGQVTGLWLVFLGWFLLSAARAEESHYLMRDALVGVTVGDVMTRQLVTAPATISVEQLVGDYLWAGHVSAVPLIEPSGRVWGLATLQRVRRLPRGHWPTTPATDAACPLAEVVVARPAELLIELIERLGGSTDGRALVFDSGVLVGIVSPTDISRTVQAATLRATPPGATPPPGPPRGPASPLGTNQEAGSVSGRRVGAGPSWR